LSAFICDYETFSFEVTKNYSRDDWKEDIKKLLRQTGIDSKFSMNLLSDSHLKLPFVLEDINNLINTGEIPFLYESDEKA